MDNSQAKFDPDLPLLSFRRLQEHLRAVFKDDEIVQAALLPGGFRNANYRVELASGRTCVMRFLSHPAETLRKEMAVLHLIQGAVPAPKPLAAALQADPPFLVIEFVEGNLLESVLTERSRSPAELHEIGLVAGQALARIHAFEFPESGFFDGDLRFVTVFPNLGQAYLDYALSALSSSRVRQRMGNSLAGQISGLLHRHAERLRHCGDSKRLSHADYNPKNILIRQSAGQWSVSAVLDWEFALSSCPLGDLGNFFRFEEELPPELRYGFIEGYETGAGPLPADWREFARLLDITAMCGFLNEVKEKPRTIATAVRVLEKTLAAFS